MRAALQSSAIDVNQTAQLVTDGLMAGESKYIEIRLSDVHGRFRLDTEGAGDWFTATLINELAEMRMVSMEAYDRDGLVNIIGTAMGIAARSIGHMGSKGLIHCADRG